MRVWWVRQSLVCLGWRCLFDVTLSRHRDKQGYRADGDRHIGEVERRPVIAAPVDVDEVDDIRQAHSIDEITQRAAENEAYIALTWSLVEPNALRAASSRALP